VTSQSDVALKLRGMIEELAVSPMTLMEVCGTHTHAIFANGIRALLPKTIKIISGPGCPVCVTSQSDVDRMIWLASQKNVVICTFGDMIKVPGKGGSLAVARSMGSNIRVMYSPFDVIEWARQEKGKEFVLVGVGFETTTPGFAATIKQSKALGIKNLSILSLNKTVPEALRALAQSGEVKLDGLILPGHVSAIIGLGPYGFLAKEFGVPGVVTGFEGFDILYGLAVLVKMIAEKKPAIVNTYTRSVKPDGNPTAMSLMGEVFDKSPAVWRGIGTIEGSGLALSGEYAGFDAAKRFEMPNFPDEEPKGCLCGKVITGAVTPEECPLFGVSCTPSDPVGPCMVSGEGTCSAYFKFRKGLR